MKVLSAERDDAEGVPQSFVGERQAASRRQETVRVPRALAAWMASPMGLRECSAASHGCARGCRYPAPSGDAGVPIGRARRLRGRVLYPDARGVRAGERRQTPVPDRVQDHWKACRPLASASTSVRSSSGWRRLPRNSSASRGTQSAPGASSFPGLGSQSGWRPRPCANPGRQVSVLQRWCVNRYALDREFPRCRPGCPHWSVRDGEHHPRVPSRRPPRLHPRGARRGRPPCLGLSFRAPERPVRQRPGRQPRPREDFIPRVMLRDGVRVLSRNSWIGRPARSATSATSTRTGLLHRPDRAPATPKNRSPTDP